MGSLEARAASRRADIDNGHALLSNTPRAASASPLDHRDWLD